MNDEALMWELGVWLQERGLTDVDVMTDFYGRYYIFSNDEFGVRRKCELPSEFQKLKL